MIRLNLIPAFEDFKFRHREAGDYFLTFGVEGIGQIVVCSMWCSCLQWAMTDANVEMEKELDFLFGKGDWYVTSDLAPYSIIPVGAIDLNSYQKRRETIHLPPWSEGIDRFQHSLEKLK